jgi:hypothetical protein
VAPVRLVVPIAARGVGPNVVAETPRCRQRRQARA